MAEFLRGIDRSFDYKMRHVKSEEAVKNKVESKTSHESEASSKP